MEINYIYNYLGYTQSTGLDHSKIREELLKKYTDRLNDILKTEQCDDFSHPPLQTLQYFLLFVRTGFNLCLRREIINQKEAMLRDKTFRCFLLSKAIRVNLFSSP